MCVMSVQYQMRFTQAWMMISYSRTWGIQLEYEPGYLFENIGSLLDTP